MAGYLDALASAERPVPRDEQALAALGPKMLKLARDRCAGAHPYLVSPAHTAFARGIIGSGPLLAPEQKVVLETDPARAREVGRESLAHYLAMPNYTNNLRRLGFGDDDLAGTGSDRLVDAIVAWGDVDAIGRRVREHHDAGADHVCIQVLGMNFKTLPLDEWRQLAALL
jgi:probable F420-dependent oxidoreductase